MKRIILEKKLHFSPLYSYLPLLCIVANETYKFHFFSGLKSFPSNLFLITTVWLALQVIFSYVFGHLSDKYCRKTILAITLFGSIISIYLLHTHFFWTAIIIDGIFCNVTPIARAAYCDVHVISSGKINIINTFIAQALPWIIMPGAHQIHVNSVFPIILTLAIVTFLLTLVLFYDFRDKSEKKDTSYLPDLKRKFFNFTHGRLALAFLLWNTVWMMIFYRGAETLNIKSLQVFFCNIVGIAFFIGVIILKIYKFPTNRSVSFIFFATFILFFINWMSTQSGMPEMGPANVFLFFTIIGGVGIPIIYYFFGEKAKVHEQGKVFGFLESIQTGTELLASFFNLIYVSPLLIEYGVDLPLLLAAALLTFKIGRPELEKAS